MDAIEAIHKRFEDTQTSTNEIIYIAADRKTLVFIPATRNEDDKIRFFRLEEV